ncbi:Gfo/Idh/MocA family protein [Photobacterium minamisatsumaniensis]|uniref:Gfo/Idh/MocA family protein n=1 Tax=Photobacterium minamisatsumaniensis TaxID=2910233 RepID=UPI003D0F9CC4
MDSIGIVGTGLMANVIAASCLKIGIPIHSVLSRDLDSARSFGEKYKISQECCFSNEQSFYSDTALKAVYIATPTALKHGHINQALRYKKHMLVEKPIPTSFLMNDVLSQVTQSELIFMDASHFVHNDFMVELPSLIHNHVGNITRIDAEFIWPSSDDGHIKFNPSLEPNGALGDLGWYPIRILQSLCDCNDSMMLKSILFKNVRDCIVGFNAIGYSDNTIFNLSSSYRGATVRQGLVISGDKGEIRVSDFVMPYCGSFVYGKTRDSLKVTISSGFLPLIEKQEKHIAFSDHQHHQMLKGFQSYMSSGRNESLSDYQHLMLRTIAMMERVKEKAIVINV